MKLIETNHGWIPFHRIVSVRTPRQKPGEPRKPDTIEYHDGDGLREALSRSLPDEMEQQGDVIPAHPGYYWIAVTAGEPPFEVFKVPIVAWQIPSDGMRVALPVTIDDRDNEGAILTPYGQVIDPFDREHVSVEAFREHVIKERTRKAS